MQPSPPLTFDKIQSSSSAGLHRPLPSAPSYVLTRPLPAIHHMPFIPMSPNSSHSAPSFNTPQRSHRPIASMAPMGPANNNRAGLWLFGTTGYGKPPPSSGRLPSPFGGSTMSMLDSSMLVHNTNAEVQQDQRDVHEVGFRS